MTTRNSSDLTSAPMARMRSRSSRVRPSATASPWAPSRDARRFACTPRQPPSRECSSRSPSPPLVTASRSMQPSLGQGRRSPQVGTPVPRCGAPRHRAGASEPRRRRPGGLRTEASLSRRHHPCVLYRDVRMPREAGRDCSCNPSAFPPSMAVRCRERHHTPAGDRGHPGPHRVPRRTRPTADATRNLRLARPHRRCACEARHGPA